MKDKVYVWAGVSPRILVSLQSKRMCKCAIDLISAKIKTNDKIKQLFIRSGFWCCAASPKTMYNNTFFKTIFCTRWNIKWSGKIPKPTTHAQNFKKRIIFGNQMNIANITSNEIEAPSAKFLFAGVLLLVFAFIRLFARAFTLLSTLLCYIFLSTTSTTSSSSSPSSSSSFWFDRIFDVAILNI